MVIDWHNFGYTVLMQNMGEGHPFVRFSKYYERWFAQRADVHFCVTRAMQQWMLAQWGIEPVVLYDKAPEFFHTTTPEERHRLFGRLDGQLRSAADAFNAYLVGAAGAKRGSDSKGSQTLFTSAPDGDCAKAILRADRPALVVSSTSWTEDEDFGMLLRAIELLDAQVYEDKTVPFVVFAITGKGPQKAMYEEIMSRMVLKKTHVCTMWLEPADYPLLLGSADFGVCLHTSTSGLDLPMKVVDMYGCGLPVCAVDFKCLSELVRHKENGMVFTSSEELSEQMIELLRGSTDGQKGNSRLAELRRGVAGFERWDQNWGRHAAPVFTSAQGRSSVAAQLFLAFAFAVVVVLLAVGVSYVRST